METEENIYSPFYIKPGDFVVPHPVLAHGVSGKEGRHVPRHVAADEH